MNEYNVYDFEARTPPRVSERELYEKARERRLRQETFILVLGTILSSLVAVCAAIAFIPYSVVVSALFFLSSAYILVGSGVVAVMFLRRGVGKIAER